jgi:hypothetical protein
MKINGKITILADKDHVTIEVTDDTSGIEFLEIEMSPVAFTAALGRLACVPCRSTTLRGIENVGKIMERKPLSVALPTTTKWKERKEIAVKLLQEVCEKQYPGWTVDTYLGSQGSFTSDGALESANTSIFRYVEGDKKVNSVLPSFEEQVKWMEKTK